MIRVILALVMLALPAPSTGQVFPMPSADNPRSQTVQWREGEPIILTAFPQTTLTMSLRPGETITRATLNGNGAWDVAVSAEADSFQVTPQRGALPATLSVETEVQSYDFILEIGEGLQAAYLVEMELSQEPPSIFPAATEPIGDLAWSYRLRGDRSVRPLSVKDNGEKTVIQYAPDQPLPAVFAVGPAKKEEVVDGYMRGGVFVIDRVHTKLIFRIDKEKATARRNRQRDDAR